MVCPPIKRMPLPGVIPKRVVLQSRSGDRLKSSRLHHPAPTDVRRTYPATAPRQSRHSPAKIQRTSQRQPRDSPTTVPPESCESPASISRMFRNSPSTVPRQPRDTRRSPATVPRHPLAMCPRYYREHHSQPLGIPDSIESTILTRRLFRRATA